MTSGAPWSVKGIDPKAREVAKDLARRSGMTLGEWLNQVILQDDGPEEVTSESFFSDRPARAPQPPPARYEAPEHPADYVERMAGLLERLTTRIESAEARTGQAVSGVEQSVRSALARIEAAEKAQASVTGKLEAAVETAQTAKSAQTSLAERLRKIEEQTAGPRSSEALRALENAITKIAGQVHEGESRTSEVLAEVEARIARIEAAEGDAELIDQVVTRVGERLAEAEGRTAEAIESLRQSLAVLDRRLQSVEDGGAPVIEQRLEALAETLTGRLEAARAEIAEKLSAGADARFDRMERTLGEMSQHVSQAEQRSARAIEQMGREVLNVAEVLNRRVQTAETRSAEAIEKVSGEMERIAQTVDSRLTRSDSVHAEALEKLGAEISRITERLSERIANAERRSAQAIDDIGEQVTRVSDRISQRAEQASGELAERIRQSEERTARLLSEARERIDQRLAEAQRAAPPLEAPAAPLPATPPVAEYEASSFPARREPSAPIDDPFAGFPEVEGEAEAGPPDSPAAFLSRAFPAAAPAAPSLAMDEPAAPVVEAEPEAETPTDTFEADTFKADAFEAEDFEAEDVFEASADEAAQAADETVEAAAPLALDPADSFAEPAEAEPPSESEPAFLAAEADAEDARDYADDDLFESAAESAAEEPDAAAQRPLTTREVVEQARAAARAAAQNGDAKKKARNGNGASEARPLFSSFGLSRPKRRAGGTLQTFLLVSGGAAALGLAAGGIALMSGQPGGETPPRVANSQALAEGGEIEGLTETPRASVALAPEATAALGEPADARLFGQDVSGPDLEALYAEAVRGLEAGEAGALEDLKKAANLGHAPAQLYLGKLYEAGRFGVKKDLAEARRWTERAAEGGDRRAMHNVALYYFNGEGGPKNSTTAAQWFRRAAEQGLVDSQYNLARLYEEGLGVSQNPAEAYKWFLIAGRSGDAESRLGAERVKSELSSEARTVAERAAVGFRPAAPGATGLASADSAVSTAQRALSKLGYYQGPSNGESSPALRLAIAAYQRDQGLAATGSLDSTTVSRLSVFTR
ncbi:MAG: peptidoglycan-binding protein [Phenylobacterium sp.]|uniref:peptidoglycan-binding protein n=1 Tax=Phenylobacterium sp. TaxID=1871053 RepID=UPI003919979C